jgi:hypothetical protein
LGTWIRRGARRSSRAAAAAAIGSEVAAVTGAAVS